MRDIDNYEQMLYGGDNDFEVYQAIYRKRRILESLKKVSDGGVIVEIGCGLEPIFKYYNSFSRYICVEPADKFYELALKQKNDNDKILLIHDFFENAVAKITMHVDCIICSSLLHEVEDPFKLLSSINKIADQDTMIHINVPNAKSLHRLLAIGSGIIDDLHDFSANNIMLQQHSVFDQDSLRELINKVGEFETLEQGSYFLKPLTHMQMKRCLDEGIIDDRILEGLYNIIEYIPDLGSEIFMDFKWK